MSEPNQPYKTDEDIYTNLWHQIGVIMGFHEANKWFLSTYGSSERYSPRELSMMFKSRLEELNKTIDYRAGDNKPPNLRLSECCEECCRSIYVPYSEVRLWCIQYAMHVLSRGVCDDYRGYEAEGEE